MQRIELWEVAPDGQGIRDAKSIAEAPSDETERLLEDLVVRCPSLLGGGTVLVGRQVPTAGGPLDLLGLDQEGRVVVFELKRGALTREAVSQVLDYASDLAEQGEEQLARLVEKHSGRDGIPKIEDFIDWYSEQYPDSDGPLAQYPRMVLVGLGVDDRARRITAFLTQRSVDIQLLTFHAFRSGGKMLIARLAEGDSGRSGPREVAPSKEGNRGVLHESAQHLGVKDLLEEVASFVSVRLPGAYQWPGKTSYSFSLQEQTEAGRPTLRAYITVYLDFKKKGSLLFNITPRAARAGKEAALALVQSVGTQHARSPRNQYVEHELRISPSMWAAHKAAFDAALSAIYAGWQRSATADNAAQTEVPSDSE